MAEMIKTRATFADYQALPETNQIVELIDGEIVMNPSLDLHQELLGVIYLFLSSIVQKKGKLRLAPTGIYFDDDNSFDPDIFWVSPENDHCFLRTDTRYWQGAPDLIVEILSPSTESRDRGVKFDIYEKHGVREYWMVNVEARYVELYQHKNGSFDRVGVFETGKSFVSDVLDGISVEVSALFP
ncbi:MAG: Uma2 family endonuclease [Anaerolineae bacterium]